MAVSLDAAVELQSAVGDRYQIDRELGRGGMATVYLAEDTRHGRLVALKVLHPELARAVGQARFRREIAIAAQLQHPHILALLDSGEGAGGAGPFWYTMPYVEGESLRERLSREHQLSLGDALRITREVASALDYAHRHGVVHRDVKPENILLSADGEALLADFGVARDRWSAALEAGGPGTGARLTDAGVSLGTLEYMSPEQTAGAGEVDGRTDVYALACVLYEMLAGEPPFTGATPQALVARRLVERPLPLRAVRDRIPASMETAVEIALARSPADRYKTAGEFAAALGAVGEPGAAPSVLPAHDATPATIRTSREAAAEPRLSQSEGGGVEAPRGRRAWWARRPAAIAIAVLAIVGIGTYAAVERYGAEHRAVMLAVLPFESVGDSSVRYFTDGVTDEIRGALAQMPGLQVIARGSSLTYAHTTKPPDQIARELSVPYLLTGEVRWLPQAKGNAIARVEAELIQAPRGHAPTVYWRQEFDIDPSNVIAVQADIATQVASVLDIALGPGERQALRKRPTNNVNAYDAFLQGDEATQHLNSTDPPALWRGIGFYTTAVTLDSNFVLAWTRLERAYSLLYANSTPNPANAEAAHCALVHAQALDPNRLESQVALSDYVSLVQHDVVKAYGINAALLKRYPDNAQLIGAVSVDERRLGHWEDALAHAQRAAKLDPVSPIANRQLASTLIRMHRFSEATIVARQGLQLAPNNLGMISRVTLLHLAQGDLPAARAVLRAAQASVDTTRLIVYFATTGDLFWVLTDAQQQKLLSLTPTAYDDDRARWAIRRAEVYGLRGDAALARAYGDTAQQVYQQQINSSPDDFERRMLYALALAYAGHKDDAIREGERGAVQMPMSRNAELAPYAQHVLARVYMMVGEPDRALDHLEPLLTVPYFLTPAWLRIDPTWAPLRGNARFERLAQGD